jgi:hypothetical protein
MSTTNKADCTFATSATKMVRCTLPHCPTCGGHHEACTAATKGELTAPQLRAAILEAIGTHASLDVRDVLKAIQAKHGRQLVVNRRPAGLQQIRQAAARMARDGLILMAGDTVGGF